MARAGRLLMVVWVELRCLRFTHKFCNWLGQSWMVCACWQSEGYEIYALVPGLAREEVIFLTPRFKMFRISLEASATLYSASYPWLQKQRSVEVLFCCLGCMVHLCTISLAFTQVRIQCEEGGRVVICGSPEQPNNPWGVTAFRKVSFVHFVLVFAMLLYFLPLSGKSWDWKANLLIRFEVASANVMQNFRGILCR